MFGCTVVVITFSKTDPEQVRASTSSSRLIGDYLKTPQSCHINIKKAEI